jgi:uncharacterized protein YjbJ (UPF0337 family)
MDWDRISGNWEHWRGRIRDRWGRLTEDQLDVIAGQRDQLAGQIEVSYGLSPDEAERQLRTWERNLAGDELEFDEADLVIDEEETGSAGTNGRG